MKTHLRALVAATCGVLAVVPANADTVNVSVTGTVEYNQIATPPLNAVHAGDPATITFSVDSNSFTNNPNFPTRGYPITQPTFKLMLGSVNGGLKQPFPGTPYFVLRNNDPAADGFLLSTDLSLPAGLPLAIPGASGSLACGFYVTYGGSTLPSLNILDAIGTYEYEGLTVFYFAVQSGPFEPIGMIFESITISRSADLNSDGVVDAADLAILLGAWGRCLDCTTCSADLNDDCVVNAADLAILLGAWG